jgi:VanZ family protein
MESFSKGYSRRRIILIIFLSIFVVAEIILICSFTSQNTTVSNAQSKEIVKAIENSTENYIAIKHEATFWRETLNLIVRKMAHFLEYTVLGIFVCALINVTINKHVRSAVITFAGCTVLALIDEFRQSFVPGRTARLTDVGIDIFGAVMGITLTTIFFVVIWKINNPKADSRFKIK